MTTLSFFSSLSKNPPSLLYLDISSPLYLDISSPCEFTHLSALNGDRAFFEVDGSLPISGEGTWTEAREGGACCQRVLRLLFACQPKMGEGT